MADVNIRQVRVALNTGLATQTQDITIPGFGLPVGAIFIVTSAVTGNTISVDCMLGVGFYDGSNQISTGTSEKDGQNAGTLAYKYQTDTECIRVPDPSGVGALCAIKANSFITDGVQVELVGDLNSAYLCTVILINGADVTGVKVGRNSTQGGISVATTFRPTFILNASTVDSGTSGASANYSIGCGVDTAATDRAHGLVGRSGRTTTNNRTTMMSSRCLGTMSNISNSYVNTGTWQNYTDTGVDYVNDINTSNTLLNWMVVGLNQASDAVVNLVESNIPTTGDYVEAGIGFQPNFVFASHLDLLTALDVPGGDNSTSKSVALTTFDDDTIYSNSHFSPQNLTVSICKSISQDNLRVRQWDDGGDRALGTGYSFNANGYTIPLAADAVVLLRGWALAIGPGAAAASADTNPFTVTIASGAVTVTGAVTGQAASTTGNVDAVAAGSDAQVNGTPQAQEATSTGVISVGDFVTVLGAPQAQEATTTGVIFARAFVTFSGTVSADGATSAGTVQANTEVQATGDVTASAAITTGLVNLAGAATAFGDVLSQFATTTGAISTGTTVNAIGDAESNAATADGSVTVTATISVTGDVSSDEATTTGVVLGRIPISGLYDFRLKSPAGVWLSINDHSTLIGSGSYTHQQIDTHVTDTSIHITEHNNLSGRSAADTHPITAITDFQSVGDTAYEVGTGIIWTGTQWESLDAWASTGYGGVRNDAPSALPDIGAGWTTMLADTAVLGSPRAVTQDGASNAIGLDRAGVWNIAVFFSLTHNEAQASRDTQVRLFNIDAGLPSIGTRIGIGRNTDTTVFSITLMVEISELEAGDRWRVEIGGGDALTAVTQNSGRLSANVVSEYRP